MKKIYVVMHDEEGAYIGHGLSADYPVIDDCYDTREDAEKKAQELGKCTHYVREFEVKEYV